MDNVLKLSVKFFFVITLTFLSDLTFAQHKYSSQNVEIKWGPLEKRKRYTTHGDFIAYDSNGHYTYRKQKNIDWLAYYDLEMSKTKEVALVFPFLYKSPTIESFIHVNNRLWVVFSDTDKKLNENSIYVQEVNKDELRLQGTAILIDKISGDYFKNMYNSYLDYAISDDGSKLLISYKLPSENDKQRKNRIHVFDSDSMKELWKNDLKFSYSDKSFSLVQKLVSNHGEVYFLGNERRSKNELEKDEVQRNLYHLFIYTPENNTEFELKLSDKFISGIKIAINKNGNINGSGFYSDKGTGSIHGSFFIDIDVKNQELVQKSFKEFSLDFIKANLSLRQEKRLNKAVDKGFDVEMYNYDLNDLIEREDGGLILVAEQYYVETRSYYSPTCKCYQTTYVYHFNDIIVVSIAPDGEIEWNAKVPKRQNAQNGSSTLGYYMGWNDEKLFFVFNDNPKNFEGAVNREIGDYYAYTGGRSAVTLATVHIDREGYYEFEPLWLSHDIQGTVFPRAMAEQLDDDVIMLFIQGNKGTQRYVKLNLK